MNALYARAQATAARLLGIDEFGQKFTLQVALSDPIYNPATGEVTPNVKMYEAVGIVAAYSAKEINGAAISGQDSSAIDGSSIIAGDMKATLSPEGLPLRIKPSDKLIFDGRAWQVVSSQVVAPGGLVLLHKVQIRL